MRKLSHCGLNNLMLLNTWQQNGVTLKEIHQRMEAVYSDCDDMSIVHCWGSNFNNGKEGTYNLHGKQSRILTD